MNGKIVESLVGRAGIRAVRDGKSTVEKLYELLLTLDRLG